MSDTTDVYWLVNPADGEIALDAGQKFWKQLIREGRWTNPRAGFTLPVDRDRLEQWRRNFAEMCDAGIRVPVPWGHSYDPRDNAGFLEELELRDGGLWGLLNVPGADDAEKLGKTVCGVSVSINPDFVDGSGRNWGEVIEHVALTNYPVVTGQGEFIHAATDGGRERRAIPLQLAAQGDRIDPEAIRKQLGTEEELTPEGLADAVRLRFDQLNAELEEHRTELAELRATRRQPADDLGQPGSHVNNRLYQLELERAERDVDEAIRLGKFTRPAAEALRQLVAAGVERKYSLDSTGADIAGLARDIIANTPRGAAVDMTEHTRLHVMPEPTGRAMTEAKAARLARENKKLAGV